MPQAKTNAKINADVKRWLSSWEQKGLNCFFIKCMQSWGILYFEINKSTECGYEGVLKSFYDDVVKCVDKEKESLDAVSSHSCGDDGVLYFEDKGKGIDILRFLKGFGEKCISELQRFKSDTTTEMNKKIKKWFTLHAKLQLLGNVHPTISRHPDYVTQFHRGWYDYRILRAQEILEELDRIIHRIIDDIERNQRDKWPERLKELDEEVQSIMRELASSHCEIRTEISDIFGTKPVSNDEPLMDSTDAEEYSILKGFMRTLKHYVPGEHFREQGLWWQNLVCMPANYDSIPENSAIPELNIVWSSFMFYANIYDAIRSLQVSDMPLDTLVGRIEEEFTCLENLKKERANKLLGPQLSKLYQQKVKLWFLLQKIAQSSGVAFTNTVVYTDTEGKIDLQQSVQRLFSILYESLKQWGGASQYTDTVMDDAASPNPPQQSGEDCRYELLRKLYDGGPQLLVADVQDLIDQCSSRRGMNDWLKKQIAISSKDREKKWPHFKLGIGSAKEQRVDRNGEMIEIIEGHVRLLGHAIGNCSSEVVKALLKAGADCNKPLGSGLSPLKFAMWIMGMEQEQKKEPSNRITRITRITDIVSVLKEYGAKEFVDYNYSPDTLKEEETSDSPKLDI
jgi:hypothetical protein